MHDVLGTLHASQAEPGKSENGSSELLQSLPQVSRGRIFWSCVQVTAHCFSSSLTSMPHINLPVDAALGADSS